MADMFPGSASLGESISKLFSPHEASQANYYQELTKQARQSRTSVQAQNEGVRDMPGLNKSNIASENSPQFGNDKNRPTPTEDPLNVEAAWTARLAKFAGIAGATGTKIGSM